MASAEDIRQLANQVFPCPVPSFALVLGFGGKFKNSRSEYKI
jgi:hypothetical protein